MVRFVFMLALVVVSTSCTSTPQRSKEQRLIFEVRWSEEQAKGLRVGSPVFIDQEQRGTVVRLETKYEHSLGETRIYALLGVTPRLAPRVEDRIALRFDEATKSNYVDIEIKEGDRTKWRPIERGMLLEGQVGPTLSEKARGAVDSVKNASSSISDSIKRHYDKMKKKVSGDSAQQRNR